MRINIFIFVLTLLFASIEAKNYHVMKINKHDWYSAFRDCLTRGFQLATVNSASEQNDLELAIKGAGASAEWLWISGTDQGNEGSFAWMSTGLGITYSKFSAGQPDNAGGHENCLHIWPQQNTHMWNDWGCNNKLFYICEEKPYLVIL